MYLAQECVCKKELQIAKLDNEIISNEFQLCVCVCVVSPQAGLV